MRGTMALLGAIAAALAVVTAGVAAPPGPEGPGNCTFENGTTTCALVGEPQVISTTTSAPNPITHCTTTTVVTETTTAYTAHHGTYNSQGKEVAAPAPVTTQSTTTTEHCP